MIGLDVVIAACVLANAPGLASAALIVHCRHATPAEPRLLSFVVGVLLGAVLLDLLPDLWEATGSPAALLGIFAAALLASRLFDSACLCSHLPIVRRASEADHHQHGRQQAPPTRGATQP